MVKGNTKNINIEVEHDVWKKLKIISINEDITLQEVVNNILIKAVSKKTVEVPEV